MSKCTVRAAKVRTNRALLRLNAVKMTRKSITLYGWRGDAMSGPHGRMSSL